MRRVAGWVGLVMAVAMGARWCSAQSMGPQSMGPKSEGLKAGMAVTLVGTGGPELTAERAGISTLVEAGGQRLLFDAGRGTLEGIYRARVAPQTVTKVFLTHLHSDHIAGLPDLWMTPWFLLGRKERLEVWGPVGTQAMIDGMRQMYGHDVEHRANAAFARELLEVTVHEIAGGMVYREGEVTVSATGVEHADGDPAFAYRVEAQGRSVFLTGDCTLTAGLVEAGLGPRKLGADVVIANVAAGTAEVESMAKWRPVFAKLLTPEQGAALFEAVRPRLAVYSHVVKKQLPGATGDAVVIRRTRKAGYAGSLRMGVDGMRIVVGETVRVERRIPPGQRLLPELDGTQGR